MQIGAGCRNVGKWYGETHQETPREARNPRDAYADPRYNRDRGESANEHAAAEVEISRG